MPPRPRRTREIDLSTISFPTDQITFGQLRKRFPNQFTMDAVQSNEPAKIIPVSALHLEMTLAKKAYAAAAGLPDPHPDDDRRMSIIMLNEDYCRFGISAGLQQTRRMVSEFETEAARQGNVRKGPTR